MFIQDKELCRRVNRSRIVEKAKEEREQRAIQREHHVAASRIQQLIRHTLTVRRERKRERRDFDTKVADIEKLKVILQRTTIPLPMEVVDELLRKLLFFYNESVLDQQRLWTLMEMFRCSINANPEANCMIKAWYWQVKRLVDISLQAEAVPDCTALFDSIVVVYTSCLFIRQHVQSHDLRLFSKYQYQFYQMPSLSLLEITRAQLLRAYETSSKSCMFASELFKFTLGTLNPNSMQAFIQQLLTVPLLFKLIVPSVMASCYQIDVWRQLVALDPVRVCENLPPSSTSTPGISSSTWLLGNILYMSDRVVHDPQEPDLLHNEVKLLSHLLNLVPLETYVANGVAMTWTKVTNSHAIPIVFPEELNQQLRLIANERRLRTMCTVLLTFNPSLMQRPLCIDRPTPLHPMSGTLAEQFGFGDIAFHSSPSRSLSSVWERVKASGPSKWANQLFEKAGLTKSQRSTPLPLINTSHHSRKLATSGLVLSSYKAHPDLPFMVNHVESMAQLLTTFVFRWGGTTSSTRHPLAIKMLNIVSFYKFQNDNIYLVCFLWSVLQEVWNFEEYMKTIDLLHLSISDPMSCVLTLFCLGLHQLLLVVDDVELYDQEIPLPLCQLERIVIGLKHALYSAYWIHGITSHDVSFGKFVIDAANRLLTELYTRCSRWPFCNVTSWIVPHLDTTQLINDVLMGTPQANKLIQSLPFILPFCDRVKLFQQLIALDKQQHQGDGSNVFRIRIRRNAIFEDGLKKIHSLGTQLKKRVNIIFINQAGREEVGIDAGGLFKEFWLDLSNLAFDPKYGLFLVSTDTMLYPNPHASSLHYDTTTLFTFMGRILGKALYEGIVIQSRFASFFLSKLLHSFNHFHELSSLDPDLYKNLLFLKTYEGDVDALGLTHTITRDALGSMEEIELIPNGDNIPVTQANKTRYLHLVAHYYLNTQIQQQSAAFRAGISDLIDLRWLQLFNEPELQVLFSGKCGTIDIKDLKAHTTYVGGYHPLDKRIQWFWRAMESFSPSERASFLRFTTSCQRAPSLGFATLTPPFTIQKITIQHDEAVLPTSSTCFNTFKLPTYSNYTILRSKVLLAISSGAGFEMT